jgi:Bacterial membrane protein YfhO.
MNAVKNFFIGYFADNPLEKRSYAKNLLRVFLLAVVVSTLFFLPFLILDKGIFLYYGDYNVQQIPFYQLAHDAVRGGDFGWSWYTDLGSNFIGSYSFYLLGSPFFWLTYIFPTSWLPYLMMPLFALKFGAAATTGYAFIRRFSKTNGAAMLGGLLYAFSSFLIYNIFFNHFHESAVLFPLLLIAMEETVVNKKHGLFALAIAVNAVNNYFFFVGQCIFLLIYFFCRCFSKDFTIDIKKFFILIGEAILGIMLAAFMLIPSALALDGNDRTKRFLWGTDWLVHFKTQRPWAILHSFFFPADIPARPNFFPDADNKWASVAAWLPMFGLTGVFSFFKAKWKDGKWLKAILVVCFLCAFIPILNSSFFAFNSSYYARWFYMMILMMALATALVIENKFANINFGIKMTIPFIVIIGSVGLIPKKWEGILKYLSFSNSSTPFPDRWFINVVIVVVSLIAINLIFKHFRKDKTKFFRILALAVSITAAVYAVTSIAWGHGSGDGRYTDIVERGLNATYKLDDQTDNFYRVDVIKGYDNQVMFWHDTNGERLHAIQTFHSIVPSSIMDFYPTFGVSRDVGSRPDEKRYGLRGLASVLYTMVPRNKVEEVTLAPGFEPIGTQNNMSVYKNRYFVPMGYTYEYYQDQALLETAIEDHRDTQMLKYVLLSGQQIELYGRYLSDASRLTAEDSSDTSDKAYIDAAKKRKESAGYYFSITKSGFISRVDLDKPNLVVYSVPFEKGWSAAINGVPATIEKVNNGFMAVLAQKGDSEIVFTYKTPGLDVGLIISGGAVIILGAYLISVKFLPKVFRRKEEISMG